MKRCVRGLPGTGTCPAAAGGGPPVQKRFGFCTRHAGRGMDAPIQRFILVVHRRASTPRHETASARSSRHRMCPAADRVRRMRRTASGAKTIGFCMRYAGPGTMPGSSVFILASLAPRRLRLCERELWHSKPPRPAVNLILCLISLNRVPLNLAASGNSTVICGN